LRIRYFMASSNFESSADWLPFRPIQKLTRPVRRFLHIESASGTILLLCTISALILANSPAAEWFAHIWHTPVGIQFGSLIHLDGDLGHLFINDILMTIFFFVVGLEIKRELILGELRDPRSALLPIVAALGGMVVPALVYTFLNSGKPGWAIPMATDIAFVVGILAMMGPRVPFGLKILLLSIAIVDDLGAVLIIAFVFTGKLNLLALGVGIGGMIICYLMNWLGVRSIAAYVFIGCIVWLGIHESGIHATVAGVMLGLLTPSSPLIADENMAETVARVQKRIKDTDGDGKADIRLVDLERLEFAARESISPLQRLESGLHPWVAFGIMPLFALANAGVAIKPEAITDMIAISVTMGLLLGKPLGIFLFSYVAVKLGWARLPQGVNWLMMLGGACLGGIGFTMALFITNLTFKDPDMIDAGKIGCLVGSLLSTILGVFILIKALAKEEKANAPVLISSVESSQVGS
jgi:Na+:H+ antiporter, NhaA family